MRLAELLPRRVGFHVDEEMSGSHRYVRAYGDCADGEERPFRFVVRWGHPDLWRFLNPLSGDFFTSVLDGTVTAGGLCEDTPLSGTLEFCGRKTEIRYAFDFSVDGQLYRFRGEKRNIRPWNAHRTQTTCHGTVIEVGSGETISEVVVRFDLATLPAMVGSFRLDRG